MRNKKSKLNKLSPINRRSETFEEARKRIRDRQETRLALAAKILNKAPKKQCS